MNKRAEEMEAVRTTIVGGRPPGSGRRDAAVPRGIEVLVKKAAVDEAFRGKLLEQRGAAAAEIGLDLDPAESAMLGVIAEEQLAGIIRQTVVPAEQRRVFMGTVAAAMLAVLGVGLATYGQSDAASAARVEVGTPNAPLPTHTSGSVYKAEVAAMGGAGGSGGTSLGPRLTDTKPATTTGTQTAPATGTQTAPAPPDMPRPVAGVQPIRPPATGTQTAPATQLTGDNAPRLLISAGILVLPAVASTQPASAPGDATSPEPPPPAMRVAGLMAPRPLATSTQPTTQPATETKPAETAPATTRQFYGGPGWGAGAGPSRD